MQNFGICVPFWNETAHTNSTLRLTFCKNYIQIGWKKKPLKFWERGRGVEGIQLLIDFFSILKLPIFDVLY